jgi:ferredoxin
VRIVIDWNLCESNAVCEQLVPEVFRVGEDDELEVLDEHPPEELRARLDEAVNRCPKAAISIAED